MESYKNFSITGAYTDENQEKLIEALEEDPSAFIEVFLERELSPKQKIFIQNTKTHKHILAIWSRQTGKSTVIASYILWRLLYGKGITINNEWMPEHIAIVAPIKDQIKNLYEKIQTLVNKSDFISPFIIKMNTEVIKCKNGNEAKFMSASPGSQIRGYTATVIVIDESQDITDAKYNGDVLPFGATTNALVIEAGTPKTKNHFYKSIQSKKVNVIKQPWYECPFLSETYVMRQKELSPEALWRQEYLCEFMESGVLAFPSILFEPEEKDDMLTGRWNLSAYDYISKIEDFTKEKATYIAELVKDGATFTAGLDLGKQNDNTVYVIFRTDLNPIKLYAEIVFELDTPYSKIAKQIALFDKIFQPIEFNFDYSNEKGFKERLIENDIAVVDNKDHIRGAIAFTNKNKAEMVSTTRILLENYKLQLPKKAENMISQFLNQQFEVTEQGIYKYFHPSNEHDDILWASLLALKNVKIGATEEITSFKNPWQKFDDLVHGDSKESTHEIIVANKSRRDRGRRDSYQMAATRRGSSFRF